MTGMTGTTGVLEFGALLANLMGHRALDPAALAAAGVDPADLRAARDGQPVEFMTMHAQPTLITSLPRLGGPVSRWAGRGGPAGRAGERGPVVFGGWAGRGYACWAV
ncbi:hypothetical protein ACWGB8_11245 [Kitasatospora sp. NPDC054939]